MCFNGTELLEESFLLEDGDEAAPFGPTHSIPHTYIYILYMQAMQRLLLHATRKFFQIGLCCVVFCCVVLCYMYVYMHLYICMYVQYYCIYACILYTYLCMYSITVYTYVQ